MHEKRTLYPIQGLVAVFIVMFICGLNWWRVTGDALSLIGTIICVAATVGFVICAVLLIVLSKYMETVNKELYRLKKMIADVDRP